MPPLSIRRQERVFKNREVTGMQGGRRRVPLFAIVPYLSFASLFVMAAGRTDAETLPGPYDEKGQVQVMGRLLQSLPERYRLLVADPFEGGDPWSPRAESTPLHELRYIFKTPHSDAFLLEKEIVGRYAPSTAFERSLFIHTSFTVPGKQSFWIRPRRPIPLEGRLFRLSLWIHSHMYLHTISLLFENARGREVRVPLGRLAWEGWKRVDLPFPPELFDQGRRPDRSHRSLLTGILIQSYSGSEPGDVALLLDDLLIVTDIRGLDYPGYEVQDDWK